jgi:hypothetical protein
VSTAARRIALGALVVGSLAGCATVAPGRLTVDRLDYNRSVAESWKEQTLLNLVRLRYADMPVYLEVASVISSRSLEGQVDMSAPALVGAGSAAETMNLGGRTTVATRPTVTYSPLTGERFTRSMMTPMQPAAIFTLIQSGWPADLLLRMSVHSINDIGQGTAAAAATRSEDAEFGRVLEALTRAQRSGVFGLQVNRGAEGGGVMLVFRRRAFTAAEQAEAAEVRRVLGLDPDATQFTLVYGVQPRSRTELAVLTRSMTEVMIDLAAGVEAPAADLAAGRVRNLATGRPHMLKVLSGSEAPADAFLAVRYGAHWFWIAGDDLDTRRIFTFLMLMLSLTESGGGGQAPLITLPTG